MKSPALVVDNTSKSRVDPARSVGEILAEPLPAYVLRPLLARRAVHVVYGDANCGKTFFTLDISARIACGGDWQGRLIEAAPVLYVAAEGFGGLPKRLRALVQQYPGLPAAPLHIVRQSVDLIDAVVDLIALANDLSNDRALGLIVLDTLAQTIGGRDENSSDMATYVQRATALAHKTDAPVLIVHHAGKDVQRGARGHSALRGNVDAVYRINADENGVRTVVAEKCRDDTVMPFCYTLRVVDVGRDAAGEQQTSCTVEYRADLVAQSDGRRLLGKARTQLLRVAELVAKNALEGNEALENGKPLVFYERLVEAWQAERKRTGAKRASPSYIDRPLADLVDRGYLIRVRGTDDAWTLA